MADIDYGDAKQQIDYGSAKPVQGQKDDTYRGAVEYGLANAVRGVGNTLSKFDTTSAIGQKLESLASPWIDPNYDPAGNHFQALSPSTWGDAPRALVEGLANNIGAMGAGMVGGSAAGPLGTILGGVGGGLLSHYGDSLDSRMANQPKGAQPTLTDQAIAGLSSGAQGALASGGFGAGLNTVARGVGSDVLSALPAALTKSALIDAGTNAGIDAIDQTGRTIGTQNGLSFDPTEALNQAGLGALGGAATRAAKSTADLNQAARLSSFNDTPAETGNLIQRLQKSDANTTDAGGAYKAMQYAGKSLALDVETAKDNAEPFLSRLPSGDRNLVELNGSILKDGETLSDRQMDELKSILSSNPAGATLLSRYVEQQQYNNLAKLGTMDNKAKTFGGGFQNSPLFKATNPLDPKFLGSAIAGETGALIGSAMSHAPGVAGMLAHAAPYVIPAGIAARLGLRGLDAMTGNANPVDQLVSRLGQVQPGAVQSILSQLGIQSPGNGPQTLSGAPPAPMAPLTPPTAPRAPVAPPAYGPGYAMNGPATGTGGMSPLVAQALKSPVIQDIINRQAAAQPATEAPPLTVHTNPASPAIDMDALAQAIEHPTPIEGTTSQQPKSTAEKPQPEDKTQTAAQTGDFHTYQGIDHPVPPDVRNRAAYVRSIENKQSLIDGTFSDAIQSAPSPETANALEDGWYDMKVTRNQDDAQGILNKIVRATPAADRAWVRSQFNDQFFGIWRKKTKNDK